MTDVRDRRVAGAYFADPGFDFELRMLLGSVHYGCGDVGEVMTAASAITDGDDESWATTWRALADRVAGIAAETAAAGHLISSREAYLRASAYYAAAMSAAAGLADPSAAVAELFSAHRRCFDRHVSMLAPPAQQVEIPYDGGRMPGYFFAPHPAGAPRPTLILNNGSDGPVTSLWPGLGAPALARGYNVLVFDGPGQQGMLVERGVPFRPDWENVITPVVGFLLDRADTDPARIALYGISQGGYWVARALAFEHRVAAAVVDPGVVDVGELWRHRLPSQARDLLDRGHREEFDSYLEAGPRMAVPRRQELAWRAKPYGLESAYDLFKEVERYRLGEEIARIRTPMLITDPDDEQFWPGQSQRLHDALPGPKAIVRFTRAEGAAGHCEPMARSLLEQRMFDWLDDTLGLTRLDSSPAAEYRPLPGRSR